MYAVAFNEGRKQVSHSLTVHACRRRKKRRVIFPKCTLPSYPTLPTNPRVTLCHDLSPRVSLPAPPQTSPCFFLDTNGGTQAILTCSTRRTGPGQTRFSYTTQHNTQQPPFGNELAHNTLSIHPLPPAYLYHLPTRKRLKPSATPIDPKPATWIRGHFSHCHSRILSLAQPWVSHE